MASAIATLTVNPFPYGVDNTQRRQILYGICALSASGTYLTSGVPLPWGTLVDGSTTTGTFIAAHGPQTTQPANAYFFSTLGSGYGYVYDTTHNTLRVFSGGTELANGAAIAADSIGFEAEFVRGQ